jgi:hypothetical protein
VNGTRAALIWAHIAHQAQGAPPSMAHLCAAAVAEMDVDGAAITVLAGPTRQDTLHSSNRSAGDLEEWQLILGQGPCLDAFAGGGPVLAADLEAPYYLSRWPAFAAAALDGGARALFALPMQVGAIRLGVFSLYRSTPGGLSPLELADALAYADAAVQLLLDATAGVTPDAAEFAWQGIDPTAHRAQVHQATGMVLAQLGGGADAAFARLRAYAYSHDRTLGDVARDVVERRLRFEPDPPLGGTG